MKKLFNENNILSYFLLALARAAEEESLDELLEDEDELDRELDPLLELREELDPLDDFDELLELNFG